MASDTLLRIAELALELERPQTLASLKKSVEQSAELFGQPFYLFGARGRLPGSAGEPVELAVTNYPREWMIEYDRDKLVRVDPVLRRLLSGYGAFRFDELKPDEEEKQFLVRRGQHGLIHGFGYATPGPDEFIGTLIYAGQAAIPKECWRGWATATGLLSGACTRAAIAIKQAEADPAAKPPVELTGSERQVLELTAQGKSAKEVKAALRFETERQVTWALESAANKMKVDRKEAVAEALHRKLIRKRHFDEPEFKAAQ